MMPCPTCGASDVRGPLEEAFEFSVLQSKLEEAEQKFKAHTEAVQTFLAEMMAVYDPCASGVVNVKDACAMLLLNATTDRQTISDQIERIVVLEKALERIERWFGEFPETGRYWDVPENTQPVSYGACYGSNGERDFMREIARKALENVKSK